MPYNAVYYAFAATFCINSLFTGQQWYEEIKCSRHPQDIIPVVAAVSCLCEPGVSACQNAEIR